MNNKDKPIITGWPIIDATSGLKLKKGELSGFTVGIGTGKSLLSPNTEFWDTGLWSWMVMDDPVTGWYKQGVEDTGLTPHEVKHDED